MEIDYKNLLYILLWLLLLYFLGIRRLALFFQRLNNGEVIRKAINWYSRGRIYSYISGFVTSFLMQSPFGAQVHIKSYAKSGLIRVNHLMMFTAGTYVAVALTPLFIFIIPTLPQNLLISTLIFSCFVKIFFPRFKFWLIDVLIFASMIILSINSVNLYPESILQIQFSLPNYIMASMIGLIFGLIFKSQVYCILIGALFLRFLGLEQGLIFYVFGFHVGMSIWHLSKIYKANKNVKYNFIVNFISVVLSFIPVYLIVKWESFKSLILKSTHIISSIRNSISDLLYVNNLFEVPVYMPKLVDAVAGQLIAFNLLFVGFISMFIVIISLTLDSFFTKLESGEKIKNKQIQKFAFIENTQFYSPNLFVDHFKKEIGKMAALLQNVISVALSSDNPIEPEVILRSKKYSIILDTVKIEVRKYSVLALKKITSSIPNQELLYHLQISEVIDKLTKKSLELINIKSHTQLSDKQVRLAGSILKNYDHLFEVYTLESYDAYFQKDSESKNNDEIDDLLLSIEDCIYEISTIIKQLKKIKY